MVVGILIFVILVVALVFGAIGGAIGSGKGRGTAGFWLGFFLGAIGLIIVAVMQPTPQAEAERLVQVQAALGSQQVRNMPQSIVRPGTAQSVLASAPSWVPPLPSQQWADALKAASSQPYPRSQQLESAIREGSHRGGLRAWLFGFDEKEQTTLVFILADRIMTMKCRDSGQATTFTFPDANRVPIHLHRDVEGNISELAIAGTRIHRPESRDALANFAKVAAQLPWISVTEDSEISTTTSPPEPSPVAVPAPVPVATLPLSVADELTKLAKLKAEGVLTDDEFVAQKAKLLS
jgi:hypothetical protein